MKRSALLAISLLTAVLAVVPALAEDGTIYDNTTRVLRGDTVRGMLLYANGTTGLADLLVTGYYGDDMTTYWAGASNGNQFVYDPYSGFWKPTPVSYEHATLAFGGKNLEGWVRSFGPRLDRSIFIGRDGTVYKRINISKKHKANNRVRRRIIYTYFINLATMERSDGAYTSFYGKSEAEQILLRSQIAAQEAALARQAAANPAFPRWSSLSSSGTGAPASGAGAQQAPPAAIVDAAKNTDAQQKSLAEIIEEQVGPYQEVGPHLPQVGPQKP